MAEAAEDELCGACGCEMVGEHGDGGKGEGAGGAGLRSVIDLVVFEEGEGGVAGEVVVVAVPVVLEGGRALLEDLAAAFGAEGVVSEAEVFVKEERAFRDPLRAIFTLDFIGIVGCFGVAGIDWTWL